MSDDWRASTTMLSRVNSNDGSYIALWLLDCFVLIMLTDDRKIMVVLNQYRMMTDDWFVLQYILLNDYHLLLLAKCK